MLTILYEDSHLIVVVKPPGMESQSARSFEPDMVSEIKKHIRQLSTTACEPYVGVIHRLDKPVGGVMVYAKTKEAAKALSNQLNEHKFQKIYLAVVCGKPVDCNGYFVDYLLKETGGNCSKVVSRETKGAKKAELSYQVLKTKEEEGMTKSLLRVELVTGRHHQIRVQCASHGIPLWGDQKYNPDFQNESHKKVGNIALFCSELTFLHPKNLKKISFCYSPKENIFIL